MTSQRLTLPFSFSGTDQRDLADLFAEYGCTTRWLGASELDLTGPTWLVEEIIEDFIVAKQVVVAHLSARSVAEA
jgi:hypothetical protein